MSESEMRTMAHYMIGGVAGIILFVTLLTPLSITPLGPNGLDGISLLITGFWFIVGNIVGLAAYGVMRLARRARSSGRSSN